ncbi:helix-turn-helix domain-containing protein [Pseudoduganella sp.]|uniref:helix-turn-helix domain-containing protein n=1 Tax=Pseudoduganella sp. TaxID=1880898 RepID=UPI0035B1E757
MDSEQEQPTSQQHASTPGAALAAAREAMGLTVEQVADQLKLAPRQVVAIEQGNYDALPNRAVTRGFIRAYAKAMRLDPAPLVALVEVEGAEGHATATVRPTRVQASFQESRFPSLTERNNGRPLGTIVAGVAVVALVGFGVAWQMGVLEPLTLATRAGVEPAPEPHAASEPAASLIVVPPGVQPAEAPLQTQNVPLISVPPQPGSSNAPATVPGAGIPGGAGPNAAPANTAGTAPAGAVAPANRPAPSTAAVPAGAAPMPAATGAGVAPAAGGVPANRPAPAAATVPAAPAPAPAAPVAAPAGVPVVGAAGGKLTLTVKEDSWIEIRRPGQNSLIARLVKAGSTETFNVREKDLLIVGKPGGVSANLAGAQLELPQVPGGTISRVNIK